jgi:uncharacterized protein
VTASSALQSLRLAVEPLGDVLVAFSGGVDSALVLAVAAERSPQGSGRGSGKRPGPRTIALTAVSPSLSQHEREGAKAFAGRLGVRHVFLESRELEDPAYAANPINRCYFCKRELYTRCLELASELGIDCVLDGFNADDARDHRPGRQAALERAVRSPLAEAGLSKAIVREVARSLGLTLWDKPASPCLSSRLPYGTGVTTERLGQVEAAEAALRAMGFREFRVRHFDTLARIEVCEAELHRALAPELRASIEAAVRGAGYQLVAIDREPLRSGRLNEGFVSLGRQPPVA